MVDDDDGETILGREIALMNTPVAIITQMRVSIKQYIDILFFFVQDCKNVSIERKKNASIANERLYTYLEPDKGLLSGFTVCKLILYTARMYNTSI